MKNAEFLRLREKSTRARFAMCDAKSVEYTRGSDNRHANFERIGAMLGRPTQEIILVYMQKHLDSIFHCIRTGSVGVEALDGRIDDVQNYLDLLRATLAEVK